MKHLNGYNESAGQPWWQVDEDEMGRHMSGQSLDTFSKAEVEAILRPARETTCSMVEIDELYYPGKSMNQSRPITMDIGLLFMPVNTLRKYTFGHERIPFVHIGHPRKSCQQIKIWLGHWIGTGCPDDVGGLDPNCMFTILKSTDDYFYVEKYRIRDGRYYIDANYICDGIDGLMSLVRQDVQRGPARS